MAVIALGIDVDTSSVTAADAALDRFEGSAAGAASALGAVAGSSQKADRGLRLVSDAVQAAEARAAAAAKSVLTLQQQLDAAFGIGAAPVRDRAADIAAYGAELDALRARFNPLFAESKKYEAELEAIARAEKLGAISAMEAAAARERAAASMVPLTGAVGNLSKGFRGLAGGQVQQAAFQVGDFAVQVGAGVSASVALAQQLPQLLGGFGILGAVLGAAVAIGVPLVRFLLDTGEAATTVEERTKNLTASSQALISINDELAQSNRDLTEAYGRNAGAMRQVIELQAGLARADFAQTMREQVAAISEMFGVSERMSTVVNELTGVSELTQLVGRLTNGAKLARTEAQGLADALMTLQTTKGPQQQAEAAQDLANRLAAASGGAENLEGKSLEAYRNLLDTARAGYETQASVDAAGGSAGGLATATAGARSEAYSLADAWAGVVGQVAAAQAAVMRAKIELDTVGNPVERAGRLAGADFDAANPVTRFMTQDTVARIAKAREETVRLREEEARLREEAARLADFTGRIGRAIESSKAPAESTRKSLGGAAGAAKKTAEELERAQEVLDEQVREHERLKGLVSGTAAETSRVADQTARLRDALEKSGVSLDDFLKTMGMTRSEYSRILDESGRWGEQLEQQKKAAGDLVAALRGLAFGTMTGAEGIGGAISALMDGAFGQALNDAFADAADGLADAFNKAMSGIGAATGLSDFATASIGTGIGMAAVGAINGNVKQIGSGIGAAVGGALGSSVGGALGGSILGVSMSAIAGPIGMVLGAALGGAVPGLFSGGRDYTRPTGTAFAGTPIERNVRALEAFPDVEGNTSAAHIAYAGVVSVVKDFEDIINRLVKSTTASAKRITVDLRDGIDVMKAVDLITLEVDRRPTSNIKKGAEERAKMFESRMLEIVDIAQQIATTGQQPLTEAQAAWRKFEAQFTAENVKILKAIGFSAKQIKDAQDEVRDNLAGSFNKEMLDTLVETGAATKHELGLWKKYELDALEVRRIAAIKTAREIGASVDIVQASFRAQKADIIDDYRKMLDDIGSATSDAAAKTMAKLISTLETSISKLTTKLNGLEQERSDVLAELTKRAEEARRAEQTLADARKALVVSDLAPGGPLDQFQALQAQFAAAIKAARGGDTGAAARAAGLAQSLLQQGQQVYASGSAYADLFKFVNSQLAGAQTAIGKGADKIENRLDSETFTKVTEKSTAALLKGLSTLNDSIERVEKRLASQEKRLNSAQQRDRVA